LQLVKKIPAFHGTRRFITALISVRHLSLSWTSPIQSIYPHPTSWRSILILIYPYTPRSPQWSPSLRFPHKEPTHPPLLTHTRHMPTPPHLKSIRLLLLFSPSHSLLRRSTVLFVKLAILQLVMKFPTLYDTLRRITVFKTAAYFSYPQSDESSTNLSAFSVRSIIILSPHLSLGFPS